MRLGKNLKLLDEPLTQTQQDTGLDNFEGTQAVQEWRLLKQCLIDFADEAEVLLRVAAATGKPYPEVIQEIRTKLKNYQMEDPKAAAAWEFAAQEYVALCCIGLCDQLEKRKGQLPLRLPQCLFTRFFANVANCGTRREEFGAAESVVAGIGASATNESPLDRISNASRVAKGATSDQPSCWGDGILAVKG